MSHFGAVCAIFKQNPIRFAHGPKQVKINLFILMMHLLSDCFYSFFLKKEIFFFTGQTGMDYAY